MKMVTAIIQPDRLDAVREALIAAKIYRITVTRVAGHGRQAEEEIHRGQVIAPNLIPKIRLDVAVNEDFVETTCEAIINAAKHGEGEIGDGKIFVTELKECIRIRTGEKGGGAV